MRFAAALEGWLLCEAAGISCFAAGFSQAMQRMSHDWTKFGPSVAMNERKRLKGMHVRRVYIELPF